KGKNVAPSLTNAGVEGIRLALIWLEQITEATGVSGAEVSYDGGGLVARIVVDYQDLPLNRLGSVEAATLLRAFSKVRQRLYVHKMTVMFTCSVTPHGTA